MENTRFNLRLALWLLVGLFTAGVAVWTIYVFQMRRHATGQLALAAQAESEGDAAAQLAALGRYLDFVPNDIPTRARYALVLASSATTPRAKMRALQALEQVLLRDPRQGA